MKKYIFGFIASMLLVGLWSCSEENEFSASQDGRSVRLTVHATRGSVETRAALNEENGNLNCAWDDGDRLLVTNTSGSPLGVLDLVNKEEGKFEGSLVGLNDEKMLLNYFYLGSGTDLEAVSGSHSVDISYQAGTMDALSKNDVLSAQAEVAIIEGNAYVSGTLSLVRHFSFGHFTLKFPEGVNMAGEAVTIAGENFLTQASISLTDRSLSGMTGGTVAVTGTNGDFYINLIPASGVVPTFKVTIGDIEYEGTLGARDIAAGIYLRKDVGVGVPVEMTKVGGDEMEDPSNPGNTEHWGGDNMDPSWNTGTPTKEAEAGGWTVNVASVYGYGGFGNYVTYNSNGLQNDLLTSKGTTAYFFQWGRWLGFPSSCNRTILNDGGSVSGSYPNSSQYLNGVEIYNTNLGYIWDNGLVVSYASCWMGNTGWTNDRVLKSSIIFGMVSSNNKLDYAGTNENCNWEDRCGNPCPDGYRIPTAKELEALIPSTGEINGSLAEIKVIDGIKYAMQWKVNTSQAIPCVEIRSVRTTANTVAVNDVIFNDAKMIRLPAYGYMNNVAELSGRGTIGVYWSCESGTNTISNTTGYGGKYLEIDFNGDAANMGMGVAPRCFGAPVLPIKDPNAKASPISPWFPVTF